MVSTGDDGHNRLGNVPFLYPACWRISGKGTIVACYKRNASNETSFRKPSNDIPLRNWARLLIIGVHALGILGSVFSICNSYTGADFFPAIISTLIGLVIGGIIIQWFVTNANEFA